DAVIGNAPARPMLQASIRGAKAGPSLSPAVAEPRARDVIQHIAQTLGLARQVGAYERPTRSLSQSSRYFQRLTIAQNSAAVRSASYTAEWASLGFHSKPAACTARESTVCP